MSCYVKRLISAIGLATTILFGPLTNIALSAAPTVVNLPDITSEIRTPVRLAMDSSGNIYVSDPKAGGVLKYDSAGTFIRKYPMSKIANGVAIAKGGELLITQVTSVAVIDPATGNTAHADFGPFKYANGIAVDLVGNIYVTDTLDDCVQKFDVNYSPVTLSNAKAGHPANSFGTNGTSPGQFKGPAGIFYEKKSTLLAVTDSINGRIQYFDTLGTNSSVFGTLGYSASHLPVKFTYPLGITFEYDAGGGLYRIYIADSFQSIVQVFDGVSKAWLADIGGYGFDAGMLFTPRDIWFDQLNKRLFVVNGSGMVSVFGISN
jgi:hypothetical protein